MSEHIVIGDVRPRTQALGDGTLTTFIYPFAIFKDEDMEVYLDDTLQVEGYSVTGAGNSEGGNVVFDLAPASGVTVTLRRRLDIERLSDFAEGGAFHADVINQELDYLVAVTQQNNDDLLRSVTLHPADADASLQLPSKTDRANATLTFDANGTPAVGPNITEIANAQANADATATASITAVAAQVAAEQARDDAQAAAAGLTNEMVEEVTFADGNITPIKNTFYNVDTSGGSVTFLMPSIDVEKEPYRIVVRKKTGDANSVILQPDGADTFNDLATDYVLDNKSTVAVRADDLVGTDNWIVSELGGKLANPLVDELVGGVDFTAGTSTSVTASQNIQNVDTLVVFMNGVALKPSDISDVSGAVITFAAAIPTGVDTIVVRHIETVEIGTPADNSVSMAKLANGTPGTLFTFDATGKAVVIGPGEVGQALVSQGAGIPPTFEAPATGILWARETQPQGTAGGTPVVGDNVRNIVQESSSILGASVVANQLTLPAGTYKVYADAAMWAGSDYGVNHQLILYNVTDSAQDIIGRSSTWDSHSYSYHNDYAQLKGVLTLSDTKIFELRHYFHSVTGASLGSSVNYTTEVYATLIVEKVG